MTGAAIWWTICFSTVSTKVIMQLRNIAIGVNCLCNICVIKVFLFLSCLSSLFTVLFGKCPENIYFTL